MVSKFPNWSYSASKWPFMAFKWVILITYLVGWSSKYGARSNLYPFSIQLGQLAEVMVNLECETAPIKFRSPHESWKDISFMNETDI